MSKQSHTHETVAWAKQRLDDVDAIISQIENTAGRLAEGARKESDAALIRLKESRAKLQKYYDDLRTDADALKRGTKKIQDAFDAAGLGVRGKLPRIAIMHTWLSTQTEGWWRMALDKLGVPSKSDIEALSQRMSALSRQLKAAK